MPEGAEARGTGICAHLSQIEKGRLSPIVAPTMRELANRAAIVVRNMAVESQTHGSGRWRTWNASAQIAILIPQTRRHSSMGASIRACLPAPNARIGNVGGTHRTEVKHDHSQCNAGGGLAYLGRTWLRARGSLRAARGNNGRTGSLRLRKMEPLGSAAIKGFAGVWSRWRTECR